MENRNTISTILMTIGVFVMLACFISGLVFAQTNREYGGGEFSFSIALYWWISGVISGMMFVGFSELVNLLQKILNRLNNKTNNNFKNSASIYSTLNPAQQEIQPENDIKEISTLADDVPYNNITYYKNDTLVGRGSLIFESHSIVLIEDQNKLLDISIFNIHDYNIIDSDTDKASVEIIKDSFFGRKEKVRLYRESNSIIASELIYNKIKSKMN